MARLMQTTNAKERVYAQSVSFFSTNELVLTALKASFTGLFGLHEATETLEAMKEGISKSLETLSEVGDKVQEEALRAGYGPTVKAQSVKKLVDAVVNFQEKSQDIIAEMRAASTRNSQEIRDAVEDGKRRLSKLAAEGNALLLEGCNSASKTLHCLLQRGATGALIQRLNIEHFLDVFERKANPLAPQDQLQPGPVRLGVEPLSAFTLRAQQLFLLVIAQRAGRHAIALGQLAYRVFRLGLTC